MMRPGQHVDQCGSWGVCGLETTRGNSQIKGFLTSLTQKDLCWHRAKWTKGWNRSRTQRSVTEVESGEQEIVKVTSQSLLFLCFMLNCATILLSVQPRACQSSRGIQPESRQPRAFHSSPVKGPEDVGCVLEHNLPVNFTDCSYRPSCKLFFFV